MAEASAAGRARKRSSHAAVRRWARVLELSLLVSSDSRQSLRGLQDVGTSLQLGLEIEVTANTVKTIRRTADLGKRRRGGVVFIRTFLSLTPVLEIKGR